MTIQLVDIDLEHSDVFCALTQFAHAGYIEQQTLTDALTAAGVPSEVHPKPPSDHVCLGRAMKEASGRHDRVEPIPGGWVLTIVHQEKLDLEDTDNDGSDAHQVSVTAKVIKVEDRQEVRITPWDSPHAALIRHEYSFQQGQFRACEDLSRWLSQHIIPWAGGVPSKARGGSYYVAKGQGLTRMKRVKTALDTVSTYTYREFKMLDDDTKTFKVPTVTQGTNIMLKPEFMAMDAVRIMLDGIIQETDRVCDELHAKLITGDLGSRGLKSQIKKAEELEDKLNEYQKALGLDLGDLKERNEELKAGLGVALSATIDLE